MLHLQNIHIYNSMKNFFLSYLRFFMTMEIISFVCEAFCEIPCLCVRLVGENGLLAPCTVLYSHDKPYLRKTFKAPQEGSGQPPPPRRAGRHLSLDLA